MTARRYRSKIVEIDALRWNGKNNSEIEEFTEGGWNAGADENGLWAEVYDYLQKTFVNVNLGDMIIKGTKGEFYPCDPEVFRQKYEEVETLTQREEKEFGLYEGDFQK